jgi:hypothetical protein
MDDNVPALEFSKIFIALFFIYVRLADYLADNLPEIERKR